MLRQGVKAINSEFMRTRALFQLCFIQFRPYAILFAGLLLSLTLMPKSKKTLGTSFNLTPSFKISVDTRERVLFRMWIIWKIGPVILFKRNMTEKDVCYAQTVRSLDCNFSFRTDILHRWWLLKLKIK